VLALVWLLASGTDSDPYGWVTGPYAALIGAMFVIGWLAKRLSAAEKAKDDMTERLIAQQEKSIPLLERVATALEERAT
jgi:hypothetical protein